MIVDFSEHDDGHLFASDVCIIGGGAAGISIAREFLKTNLSVVMLEGGGSKPEKETQELYRSEVAGLAHKGIHEGRARVFGGTTTLWAGQTLPLDESDFQRREWVAGSGWPIARRDLEPYYRRAEETLSLSPLDYDVHEWPFPKARPPAFDPSLLRPVVAQFSPKPDFAVAYRRELSAATNVKVVLHANAMRLSANADATMVDNVEIRSLSGRSGRARARAYVVCCGGIETPRLLLASNNVEPNGLGNGHDLVGRYFQDHLQAFLARIDLTNPETGEAFFKPFYWRGIAYGPRAVLSAQLQQQRKTLNATLGVVRRAFVDQNSATEAAKRIVRGILRREFGQPVGPDLRRVIANSREVAASAYRRFVLRQPAFQMSGEPFVAIQCECEPAAESRVMLGAEVDRLGMRRTKLDWRLTSLVLHTAEVGLEIFASELKRLELGEVALETFDLPKKKDWQLQFWDSNHHIGTCRMSAEPRNGVVNRDCRLHTIRNVFIASSAVFPTGGNSNPTFTIIVLAIRLADHLKAMLQRGD